MGDKTYAEISEKKTSKLGYLILIALFFFLIIIGQTVFSDISRIPERPISPSHCANIYAGDLDSDNLEHLKYINYKQTCRFNGIDREFGIDILINSIEPDLIIIIGYNEEISGKNNLIYSNERQLNELLQRYGLSLQETIADEEEVLMDKPEIKSQIVSLRTTNDELRDQINDLDIKRNGIIQRIAPKVLELKNSYSEAQESYKTQMAYYNLKIFLLELVFVLPFFALSLYHYLKHKKRDSPYTIIITSVFYASTILFLQVVLSFLYQILPMGWLARIFEILMSVSILRYVVYYGVTGVVILILGSIVYYIQKKIYDPKRVAMRQLKDNKCPSCSFSLDLSNEFCPNCGRHIKTKCSNCGNLRYTDLSHCPVCGSRE